MTTLEQAVKRGAIKTNKGSTNTLPSGRNGRSELMTPQMDYSANAKKKSGSRGGAGDFKGLKGA